MSNNYFCDDCRRSKLYHVDRWVTEIMDSILPPLKLSKKVQAIFDACIEKVFVVTHLATLRTDFTLTDVPFQSWYFIEELKKRGAVTEALWPVFGSINHFKVTVKGKVFRFQGLPIADFLSKYNTMLLSDKAATRHHAQKGGFPIPQGHLFSFWQQTKALNFGLNIGFPLVVKPARGSLSRHVSVDIRDEAGLKTAIRQAVSYAPSFIVERFVVNTSVYRVTVIDFDFVVCVKRVPANVVGDGVSTIRMLIDAKNRDPRRGESHERWCTLYKIIENTTTTLLLAEKKYTHETIPQKGEVVYLQKDPFLKLGGDLVEVTPFVHPDNVKLFRDVARFFDTRVTGIDFLAQDTGVSWREQSCAILELNSVPGIDVHHVTSSGEPTNPAKALADMFFKYYVRG